MLLFSNWNSLPYYSVNCIALSPNSYPGWQVFFSRISDSFWFLKASSCTQGKEILVPRVYFAVMLTIHLLFLLQVGRTERLDNTLNPQFSKAVFIDYFFEELQKLKFFIYDIDNPNSTSLKSADFLGEMECTLGQVSSSIIWYCRNILGTFTRNVKLFER